MQRIFQEENNLLQERIWVRREDVARIAMKMLQECSQMILFSQNFLQLVCAHGLKFRTDQFDTSYALG